jgi:hypothetical protein
MEFTPSMQKGALADGQRPQYLLEVVVVVSPDTVERRARAAGDRAPS